LFFTHESFESYDVIDLKIEIPNVITTFSIAWQFESIIRIELEIELILSWIAILISSIWVRLQYWYQVFQSN